MAILNKLIRKLLVFYKEDCCWPYSLSFFLILIVYLLEFYSDTNSSSASLIAYLVIFAYYLYNIHLYRHNKLDAVDIVFFVKYLTFKIIVLSLLLILLQGRV